MGFPIVEVRMPEMDGNFDIRLQEWLVPVGKLVVRDKPVARLLVNGQAHHLSCNMDVVIEEMTTAEGEAIAASQVLARAMAEGHEIPYGRPYTRLEPVV